MFQRLIVRAVRREAVARASIVRPASTSHQMLWSSPLQWQRQQQRFNQTQATDTNDTADTQGTPQQPPPPPPPPSQQQQQAQDEKATSSSTASSSTASSSSKSSQPPPTESAKVNELTKALADRDAKLKLLATDKLRMLADMENVRRVAREDVDKASKFGVTKLAKQMLEVADDVERFMAAVDVKQLDSQPDLKLMHEGMVLVQKKLQHIFGTFKIVKFDSLDKACNPDLHDILFEFEDPAKSHGTVGSVVRDGYMIGERVLRAAQVGTIKQPSSADEGNNGSSSGSGANEDAAANTTTSASS